MGTELNKLAVHIREFGIESRLIEKGTLNK